MTEINARMMPIQDTAANFEANDPILLSGEWGYETDTGKYKAGDGETPWNGLSYKVDVVFEVGDKDKLDGIEAGAQVNVAETDPVFVVSEAANFEAGDKSKLDGIEAGAQVNVAETDPVFVASEAASFETGDKSKLDGVAACAVGDNSTKPSVADDDGVAEVQSLVEAGNLTLDGADVTEGVATFDIPRKVTITSDTDMRGITLTVVGTDEDGDPLTEGPITGPDAAATVTTTGWFSTVTQVSVSAAGTNLKVGKGAGLVILDLNDGNVQKLTVGADCTIDFVNWKATGIMDTLILRIDNTDNHTITWTGVDNWGAGAVPGFGAANVEVLEIYTMDGGTTVEAIIKAADMSAAS
jgi:hypothetical protein